MHNYRISIRHFGVCGTVVHGDTFVLITALFLTIRAKEANRRASPLRFINDENENL